MNNRMLACFLVLWLMQLAPPQLSAQPNDPELKKLLKERSELLDRSLQLLMKQYAAGAGTISDVLATHREALHAAIDLCDGPKERVVALKKYRESAEAIEKMAEAYFKAALVREADFIRARTHLLTVRIELLKEEKKLAPRN